MFDGARRRAKEKGWDFDLKRKEIIIPDVCPVLQIPLYFTPGKQTPNSPSFDRLDNNQGYTKANVRVISWRANELKRNATLQELINVVLYMAVEDQESK